MKSSIINEIFTIPFLSSGRSPSAAIAQGQEQGESALGSMPVFAVPEENTKTVTSSLPTENKFFLPTQYFPIEQKVSLPLQGFSYQNSSNRFMQNASSLPVAFTPIAGAKNNTDSQGGVGGIGIVNFLLALVGGKIVASIFGKTTKKTNKKTVASVDATASEAPITGSALLSAMLSAPVETDVLPMLSGSELATAPLVISPGYYQEENQQENQHCTGNTLLFSDGENEYSLLQESPEWDLWSDHSEENSPFELSCPLRELAEVNLEQASKNARAREEITQILKDVKLFDQLSADEVEFFVEVWSMDDETQKRDALNNMIQNVSEDNRQVNRP